jgi:hypothetical protein
MHHMLLMVLLAVELYAPTQVSPTTGSIRGQVTDPSGAVVSGASVKLTNESLGISRQADTLTDGVVFFPFVEPASGYRLEIIAPGFQRSLVTDVTVRVTEVTVVNVPLTLETVQEEISVTAGNQSVQTTNPTLGGTLGPEIVTALLLNTRNVLMLLGTDAGVAADPGNPTTLFVAGSRAHSITTRSMESMRMFGSGTSSQAFPFPILTLCKSFEPRPASMTPRWAADRAAISIW